MRSRRTRTAPSSACSPTKARDSTSFPAANSFASLRPAAKRGRCTFAGVGKSREEIEYALDRESLLFQCRERSGTGLHRSHRRRERRARADCLAGQSRRRGRRAQLRLDRTQRKQVRDRDSIGSLRFTKQAARMPHISIRGLQMHIGSQITEARALRRSDRESHAARRSI